MHVARAQDWIVIIGVMGSFVALYTSAIFILARPFIAPKQIQPKLGLIGALVLAATAFSIGCIAYAYFIEPYQLDVKHIKLTLADIPRGTKPIIVVQVSDLHSDAGVRLENKVAEEIEKLRPNVILFTGDAVNSFEGALVFNAFAARIKRVAETFAVKGDWDFAFHPHDILAESGLGSLSGFKIINANGIKLCIIGADSGASCKDASKFAPKGLPTIMMYHNPDGDVVLDQDMKGIDLYVCGHTHGGQIALPFYGAMITQSVQGKKYESGLHRVGDAYQYTNRGIGMEGHFPRLRFCSPPELTVFELVGPN